MLSSVLHVYLQEFYVNIYLFQAWSCSYFTPFVAITNPFEVKWKTTSGSSNSPTNISHIRGNIFLDSTPTEEFLHWPSTSPPFQVSEDLTRLRAYPKLANCYGVRSCRSILEAYRLGDNRDVRWYMMGDDDTLFFVDNIVDVLSKYDHIKYHYIGADSEVIGANNAFSFDMAFGGGYALSLALVEAVVPV
ncbi:hypothetical protein SLEP1_g7557 [Rubroshorea leprosula]|uniref:Fringe-like glycosyltransferase domain-containing protein n=1 Tax=Rubroshorea leprosula TaxID=152421 RepID=A0AAV5I9R7_9ROSI|nr:hypothetical protein SLEP1_g7557 [Rubroshorea leprosula]